MKFIAMCRYRWFSIIRAGGRTLLIIGFTLLLVLSMVWLGYAIEANERAIDRIYDETLITGEVRPNPEEYSLFAEEMGNLIRQMLVDRLMITEYFTHIYFEIGENRASLLSHEEAAEDIPIFRRERNWIIAPSCFDEMVLRNEPKMLDIYRASISQNIWEGELLITFADGFDESDLVYDGSGFIPLVVHEHILNEKNISLGDEVYIISTRRADALVIGMYSGGHHLGIAWFNQPLVFMPPEGLYEIRDVVSHTYVRFHIDPKYNRQIDEVFDYLNALMLIPGMGGTDVIITIDNDVIRFVIAPLELNLQLLHLLYPVVMTVASALAIGFPILLLLQSTKNAAIVRSLGASKIYTRFAFFGEYIVTCLFGIVLCFITIFVFDLGISDVNPFIFYLISTSVGAITGTFLITARSPLELLQVRE
jgi:hypothetical protein